MTGSELRAWRDARHYTRKQLAPLLGTSHISLYRWEKEYVDIPQVIELLVLLYTDEKNIQKVQKKVHLVLD